MKKTVIITGATSGIGYAVARSLLAQGCQVIGLGHSQASCDRAAASLAAEFGPEAAVFLAADLLQQREVNRAADQLAAYLDNRCGGELHVLVNNAGCVRSWYTTTEEGYEQQFALNHLAGFILTYRLLPYLLKSRGKVLFTGSGSHKRQQIHWRDVMLKDGYNPLRAYKQTKLCNMLFAHELNNRYQAHGLQAYVVDPGLVKTDIGNKDTGGLVSWIWNLRKRQGTPPEVPARTYAFLCGQESPPEGLYFYNSRPAGYSRAVTDASARRLFALSEQLCSISYGGAV